MVVHTPFGPKTVGEAQVGDSICDAFGGVQEIIGIRDWEDWQVWRVRFHDRTHLDVSPEHEWTGWWSGRGRKIRGARLKGPDAAVKLETQHIKAQMWRRMHFYVPVCEPTAGNYNRYEVDPYTLGAFIGDGYLGEGVTPTLTNHLEDREIADRINVALDIPLSKYGDGKSLGLSKRSFTYSRFKALGLIGKRAWEKKLPPAVFATPTEWRWSLMQGLMDTDGWVESRRAAYYTTTSPRLADQVADLARSLGCFVTLTEKHPTYTTADGERLDGRSAWTLRIKSATPSKLFHLRRKREIAATIKHQMMAKKIVTIEDTGRRDTIRCFHVSHPSGLYVTDAYTVTHNSDWLLADFHQQERKSG